MSASSRSIKPAVIIGSLLVLAIMAVGFVVYATATGSGNVSSWLDKNYTAADADTARTATDREAAFGSSFTAGGSTTVTTTMPAGSSTAGTTPVTAGAGSTTGTVPKSTILRPDAMYVATTNVTETAASIQDQFGPNDVQTRDGRMYLEYEDAVVGVVPALAGAGALVFLDRGDTGYRRWGHHTGGVWGVSRAGRSFSSGGGSGGGGAGRGGGSGGGK